ncbi:MAG: renalase [Oleiphilaceae bacterium]|jgi:renalase
MLVLDVLVIGAGMSGLIAARELQKFDLKVACVEKARGSGGRLSSKRFQSELSKKILSFDLGCTSFDAQTELFRSNIEQWISKGVAKTWRYSNEAGSQYVGVPRNSSITRNLADELDVHFSTQITEIKKVGDFWQALIYKGDEGNEIQIFAHAKHIVLATPPQQAADLLPENHPFKHILSQPILLPQWVLMLNIKGRLELTGDYSKIKDSIISRLILEQGKPERDENSGNQLWVIHADPDWSAENLETDKGKLINSLVSELASITGSPVIIEDTYLHRWLYSIAQVNELTGRKYLSDDQGIWLCGDYLADTSKLNGLEAAFTSGYQLAKNFQTQKI